MAGREGRVRASLGVRVGEVSVIVMLSEAGGEEEAGGAEEVEGWDLGCDSG